MKRKQVRRLSTDTMTWRALATFTLDDGAVHAEYEDADYGASMQRRGVLTAQTGRVRPSDGQVFYDALDVVYSNSSMMDVVTVD